MRRLQSGSVPGRFMGALAALALVLAATLLYLRTTSEDSARPMPVGTQQPTSPATGTMPAPTATRPPPAPAPVDLAPDYAGPRPSLIEIRKPMWAPSGTVSGIYEQLIQPARDGDAKSAYLLGLSLHRCASIPGDSDALEGQIQEMRDSRNYDTTRLEQHMRSEFEDCVRIPPEERYLSAEWIRQAAEGGLMDAQVNLPFYPPPDLCAEYYRENCSAAEQAQQDEHRAMLLGHLIDARDAGSADVLWHLGGAYLNGELVQKNDIQAYAHLRAMQAVFLSAGQTDRVGRLVEEIATRLRPIELTLGEEQAMELLANPDCCVLFETSKAVPTRN